MVEDTKNPQAQDRHRSPSQAHQDRRHPQSGSRHHYRRDHSPRPPAETPPDLPDKEAESEEEEESGEVQNHSRSRSHRGRPPKKIIEEWANDPYCE